MANLMDKILILMVFLIVHLIISHKGWYHKHPSIDALPHLLGGIALGAFIKEIYIGIPLIFLGELFQAALLMAKGKGFKESSWNKARDIFFSAVGYIIGLIYL